MSTGTCDTNLNQLRRLANAATLGPWKWGTSNSVLRLSGSNDKDGGVISAVMHSTWPDLRCDPADQAFIAAADPFVVGSLIDRICGLQMLLDRERTENEELVTKLARLEKKERPFPMERGPSIPWKLAEAIYAGYAAQYGTSQSLDRLAERGGFGWPEVEIIYKDVRGRKAVDAYVGNNK